MFVPKGNDTYKVYEQKNAIQKDCTLGTYYISKEKYDSLFGFSVQPFDIIVSCAGTIGETYVLPQHIKKGIINQALMLIRLYCREIEQFYLLYFDFILKEEANTSSKGTAIKNIPPFDVLKNFYIPIPPLKEQRRILDEVNKWLSFVESVETSTLNLQDTIKQTKSKILDLAIHGKLVPQNPADEPASELLKRINPKAEIACDNEHYPQLPKGWCTTSLKRLQIEVLNGYAFQSCNYTEEGVRIIRIANVQDGQIVDDSPKFYPIDSISEIHKYQLRAEDLLMSLTGNVGRVGFLPQIMLPAALNQRVCCIRTTEEIIYKKYLYIFFQSNLFRTACESSAKGVAQLNVSTEWLKNFLIALPPLAEQKRIVEKIEQLFCLLEQIEESL